MITREDIRKAYVKIRSIDNTIPDEVLDFMKNASFNQLKINDDNQLKKIYITSDNQVFYQRSKAENYCRDILEEGDDVSKHIITTWYNF